MQDSVAAAGANPAALARSEVQGASAPNEGTRSGGLALERAGKRSRRLGACGRLHDVERAQGPSRGLTSGGFPPIGPPVCRSGSGSVRVRARAAPSASTMGQILDERFHQGLIDEE